ncbi:chemotaxis protein CheW [Candidatus Dependentiae bacterium]|nr:chemotaxis protein CheW [Candidatus Dependentiae bacterium]
MTSSKLTQIVTFELNNVIFGIDVFEIDKILKKENLIDLPRKEITYLIAMIKIESEIISVVSLRKRFSIPIADLKKEKIIVIRHLDNLIGLLVDNVKKLIEFEEYEKISTKTCHGLPSELFTGKINAQNMDIFIIDVFKLLEYSGKLTFKFTKKKVKKPRKKKK